MITLSDLYLLTAKMSGEVNASLPCILFAWAQYDPGQELAGLLKNTSLDVKKIAGAMKLFISQRTVEDQDLLNEIILSNSNDQITGWHLLKKLSESPNHRITCALVKKGLNLASLIQMLEVNRPEASSEIFAKYECKIKEDSSVLLKYGRDLTRLAQQGTFDDLCDRPRDLERVTNVFLKHKKVNGAITGPAGVGKTALAELFAKSIVTQKVPKALHDISVFELSMSKLLAGTMYRGQFEERLEKLIAALKKHNSFILFIDEMHLMWGAGRAEGAPMDAANILKPFLSRGELRVFGATTSDEYYQYIARDAALARRFEEIRLEEPDPGLILQIVRKQASELSKHHQVKIPDETVRMAIDFSDRYLPNKWQPDKSVDLLDACSVHVIRSGRIEMVVNDLLNTLARQTGRPIASLIGDDRSRLNDLETALRKRIIGQGKAIEKVVNTLIYRRLNLGSEERNLGTFLFAGETGVGKTELGRSLGPAFFGKQKSLLHLDLAEYNYIGSVNKLIGSPSGYIGSEQEGVLTRWLHNYSCGVLLFDEIEKAHPEVHRLLLGLIDNGRIRTARGELLDTRQCIVVFTTNAISPVDLKRRKIGFTPGKDANDPSELLAAYFPHEFLGRFDDIILFDSLTKGKLREILRLRLTEAIKRLSSKNIQLLYEEETLLDFLLDYLTKSKSGARGITRLLEAKLLQPLSAELLKKRNDNGPVKVELTKDCSSFKFNLVATT